MSTRLCGKVVVVTGGGSGIGEAICSKFSAEGASLAVLDLNKEAAECTVDSIRKNGGIAHPFRCDVTDINSIRAALDAIEQACGRLTTLVNNAGIAHIGNIENTSAKDLDRIYQVNVKGVYNCSQIAISLLKQHGGGSIINIASVAATTGIPDRFAYSLSKGAVMMMTRSIACDYLKYNIRCNCISPARVHTPFVDRYLREHYPGREQEMFEKLAATQPLGRMGRPEEVSSLAVFLVSDESTFVTGANYEIDGGFNNLRP